MAMRWDSHGVQPGISTLLPLFRDSPCCPNSPPSLPLSLSLSHSLLEPHTVLPPRLYPVSSPHILSSSTISVPPAVLTSESSSSLCLPATPGPLTLHPPAPFPFPSPSFRHHGAVVIRLPFLLLPHYASSPPLYPCPASFHRASLLVSLPRRSRRSLFLSLSLFSACSRVSFVPLRLIVLVARALFRHSGYHPVACFVSSSSPPSRSIMRETDAHTPVDVIYIYIYNLALFLHLRLLR